MPIKYHLWILVIALLLGSCGFYNRMTSPEVLDKKERIWSYGMIVDPLEIIGMGDIGEYSWGIQPIISYRSGIEAKQEIGISLYGVYMPGIVVDHKYKYLEKENFILSGDLAAYAGLLRPVGLQYDLIFGKRSLYGTCGLNYDFLQIWSDKPFWHIGIGSDMIGNSPFGFQISYSSSFAEYYIKGTDIDEKNLVRFLSVAIKIDLLKTKKKYRNNYN